MRDYDLLVPKDCCVSNTPRENEEALALMRKFLKADTRPSNEIQLRAGAKKKKKRAAVKS